MAFANGVYDGRRHRLQIDVYDPDDNIDTCSTVARVRLPAADGSGRRKHRTIAAMAGKLRALKNRRYRNSWIRVWQRHGVFARQQILPFVL